MKTLSTIIASVVITSVIVFVALQFANTGNQVAGATSSTGVSFNTARFAGITMSMANVGANGTSTSILNSDSTDRYVTSLKVACQGIGSSFAINTGAGIASLNLTVATSTIANPASLSSANAILASGVISTTSTTLLISSSTAPVATGPTATSSYATVWNTGTYMTFQTNATNTAACTLGVDYIGA